MEPCVPTQAVVELTKQCNLCCQHCGSGCTSKADPKEMNVEEWKDCIDQLAALGTEKVIFSGGEPTLKDQFDELIVHVGKRGLKYAFITNGYELPDTIASTISKHRPYAVGVSIDGMEGVHNQIRRKKDSWSRALETIRGVKNLGIQVCVVTTVSRHNLSELDLLADFLSKEVDSWQIQLATPFGRMAKREDALLSEDEFTALCRRIIIYRHVYPELNIQAADCFGMAPAGTVRSGFWGGCSAGVTSLGIDACGSILPCLSLQSGATCGNLRERSLEEIWKNSEGFALNRRFHEKDANGGKCEGCEELDLCRGGCASQSYAYYGRFHSSPFCYERTFHLKHSEGGVQDAEYSQCDPQRHGTAHCSSKAAG
ncbi:MAG: radical SAM protein [bacterium]|nr:radical SAM protein [bacterium]